MKKLILTFVSLVLALALAPRVMSLADLTSEVRMLNGLPALYVNSTLTSQMLASPYRPGPSDFNDFRQAGISIFNVYLRFDWSGPEQYNFARVDEKIDSYQAGAEPECAAEA